MATIIKKITRFRESIVVKNTFVLFAGQIFSRLLQIIYVAALARYIGAEGVGKISTATALNGLIVLFIAPGLTTLLIRDVSADKSLSALYLGNSLFIRSLLGIPFILLAIVISFFAGYPLDTLYIIVVYSIVYLFDTIGEIFTSVYQAFEIMEYEALAQVIRDLVNVVLSMFLIFIKQPLIIIVLVSAIAQVTKLLLMANITHRRLVPIRMNVNLNIVKNLLTKSLPFGALVILFSIRYQVGLIILSLYESPDAVGIYSAATTLILILVMLPGAFSSAVFPVYSRMYKNDSDNLPHFYQLSYKYLMLVGFPIGLITMIFGGKIVEIIYGEDFKAAGTVIMILAASLFGMMGYSNGPLLNAIGKQRFFAWTQALLVFSDAMLCLILVPTMGTVGAALAATISSLGGLFVHSFVCHRWLKLHFPWMIVIKTFMATLVMGGIIYIATASDFPWWTIVFILAPLVYVLLTLLFKLIKVNELRFLARGTTPLINS